MVDWLKLRHTFTRNPKLRVISRALRCSKHEAIGLAVSWLLWVDEQTMDGGTQLTEVELDEELGRDGISAALMACGWAELGADGFVRAVDFEKHCGETSKKRADNARRKALCVDRKKEGNNNALPKVTKERYQEVTEKALPEEEEEEEICSSGKVESNTTVVSGAHARPEDAEEVAVFMKNQAAGLGTDQSEVLACAESFFHELEAVGWVNGKGVPVRDWRAMARSYLNKWMRNRFSAGRGGQRVERRSERPKNYEL